VFDRVVAQLQQITESLAANTCGHCLETANSFFKRRMSAEQAGQ
jgi:bacterioferritin-associated ferredoxin